MGLSERMLALIQKIADADAAHFAALRESAKQEAAERAKRMEKKRANLRVARAAKKKRKVPAPPVSARQSP